MKHKKSLMFLREVIREMAEDGFDRDDLAAFIHQAMVLSYDHPDEAERQSARDLDELENML
ncbi:MAG TPA: hypothetical protein VHD56_07170 [Tepidisphaeraceae bacterium]|jgi:hypothetical protein|nr:hypothetical protein [Tepidisphaeraceae bacterium]